MPTVRGGLLMEAGNLSWAIIGKLRIAVTESRFIVCEQTNHWAVAFRRQLRHAAVAVGEARSLDQCADALSAAPRSVVAIEVTRGTLAQRIRWLFRARTLWPHARTMVLACRGMEGADWLLRDAGAVYILYTRRNMAPAARLVQRIVDPQLSSANDLRQRIWAQLPLAASAERNRGAANGYHQ